MINQPRRNTRAMAIATHRAAPFGNAPTPPIEHKNASKQADAQHGRVLTPALHP